MKLTARLDRPHIPPSGAVVQLLVQLTAPAQVTERLPLNLAAVVDRSGSMDGPKLDYTKQALLFLVDQVAPQDQLAVITYDDEVQTLFPSQPITHKDMVKAKLARIRSGGATNLSGGLATGMQQVAPHAGPDRVSRTLLMTDGLANRGVTDPAVLTGWVRTWRERGLTLSTLGVGDDFNEDLLVALAEAGGGNFHYVADPDQIPAIFAGELDGLLQVVAQGLHLKIEAEPGVAITGVIGYPPGGTPHAVGLPLPDIYSGEVKSLLISLEVAAPAPKLARITLDYMPAQAGAGPETLTVDVTATITEDEGLLAAPPDPEVRRQLSLARAVTARDEAVILSDQGDLHGAADRLAEAMSTLAPLAFAGDAGAREQLQALTVQEEALRGAQYDKALRKRMRHEAYQAKMGRAPR